jgi:hypothetical protein
MIDRPDTPGMPTPNQGVHGISVAAELSGIARILDLQDDNAELLAANRAISDKAKKKATPQTDNS